MIQAVVINNRINRCGLIRFGWSFTLTPVVFLIVPSRKVQWTKCRVFRAKWICAGQLLVADDDGEQRSVLYIDALARMRAMAQHSRVTPVTATGNYYPPFQ